MDDTFDNWLQKRESNGVDDDGRLVAGTIIGEYKIVAFLGRGGFAEVYRAVPSAEEHVAIKILHRLDDRSRLRFEREAKILSQINHPNAPRLLGFGSCGNRPYLVAELLHAKELPRTDRAIAQFVRKVCAAVAALHEMGYVHRDIKPSNILWRGDEPVLIDYGLACPFSDGELSPSTLSIADGNRVLVGTVGYAAPEQFAGGKIDASTDIHAIGMMINACFEDRPPRRWKKIIDRATNSRSNARYTTVGELARAVARRYFGVLGWMLLGIPLLWLVVTLAIVSVMFYIKYKYDNLPWSEAITELDGIFGCVSSILKPSQPRVVDRALYVPDELTADEVAELNGDDWCVILKRRPELYKQVPFNKLDSRSVGQLVVNVPDLMANAKEALQGASWDVWLNVLMADPEQACNCDLTRPRGMFGLPAWGDIFLAFPQFVDKCDFTKLESREIKDILMKNPHLVDRLDLSKLSGREWVDVLLVCPEFERYCDFARLSGHDWASILEKTSRYDVRCDFSLLNGHDWASILEKTSRYDNRCNFSLLNGNDWKWLLEHSARYDGQCDYKKLNGSQWVDLLSQTTRFDKICDYKKFSARDWGKLISVRPKLAIRYEKTFSGNDAIEFLRECPRMVEKCDLTHMSAHEWGRLLKDNPQMVDLWDYCGYGNKEWHDFSFAYFSRNDGVQLCRDKISALKLTPDSRQKLEKYVAVPSDEKEKAVGDE